MDGKRNKEDKMSTQDLVVIGGGTSGFTVAHGACRLGLTVTLIEQSTRLGGSALHSGCIPSKALMHVSQIASLIKTSADLGLEAYLLPVNMDKVNTYINQVKDKLAEYDNYQSQTSFREAGGNLLFGSAKILSETCVQVDDKKIDTKKIVISSGSKPILPDFKGIQDTGYLTSDDIFNLKELPGRLIILGSKPSAIEFAQAFTRLGTKVIVVERAEHVLPQEDLELMWKLRAILESEGIEFYTNTIVQEAYVEKGRKILDCIDGRGKEFTLFADEIFASLGRKPAVEGLGLENAGVEYTKEGVVVDERMQTTQKNIFALGDVSRTPFKLTHAAEYQASVVLSNIGLKIPTRARYQGFPYVIFTDPEYAHVGLNESQAVERNIPDLKISKFEFKNLDSAITKNTIDGMIKVVSSRNKILGATILGPHASNLISEWSLALQTGARLSDISATVHAYPTLAQINRRVASKESTAKFFDRKARGLRLWFQRAFA